jgi:hypothetical protein
MVQQFFSRNQKCLASGASEDRPANVPDEFICPLTLEIFSDPLMSKHGHNFERNAILEWLAEGNPECPLTRKPLSPSMLFPNVKMRLKVKKWQEENNLEISCGVMETCDGFVDGKLVFSTSDIARHRKVGLVRCARDRRNVPQAMQLVG